jgi:hypothetical protein
VQRIRQQTDQFVQARRKHLARTLIDMETDKRHRLTESFDEPTMEAIAGR